MVNDDRNPRAFRREPAQNAGLAAVGVDERGLLFPQDLFQFAERDEILERMDRPDEFRHQREQSGNFPRLGFERAFGAGGGAGDQVDFETGFLPQPGDGGQRVLLRAADHEPGDDVRDAHGGDRLFISGRVGLGMPFFKW